MKTTKLTLTSLAALVVPLALVGCKTQDSTSDGTCTVDTSAVVDCSIKKLVGSPVSATDAGLTAYLCTGTARPDENPRYLEGMPKGTVCADEGDFADVGRGYCCTQKVADCAFDPVAICPDDTYSGYQCHGTRPDFLNPKVYCREGWIDGDHTNYCCRDSSLPKPDSTSAWCQMKIVKGITCGPGLVAWQCPETERPVSENIPQNGSRSDFYAPMCSAMAAAASSVINYCCFTPKPLPVGASCEERIDTPNCAFGRFGFACYGADKPSDYHPMVCDAGFAGTSDGGYQATLYCCDYDLSLPAATP